MTVRIVVQANYLPQVAANLRIALPRLLQATAKHIVDTTVEEFRDTKSGRFYPSKNAGPLGRFRRTRSQAQSSRQSGVYQASAPGEAPAMDTTALANSLQVHVLGALEVEVVAGEHAVELEYGTARIEPRPFFEPAALDAVPFIEMELAAFAENILVEVF